MKIIAALLMMGATAPVLALDFTVPEKLYLGGSYSTQDYAGELKGRKLQALGLTVGYQLNDYFALESRFNRGVSGYASFYDLPGSSIGDYREQLGWQSLLAVKASYPVISNLSVYGLLGYSNSDLKVDLLSASTDSQSGQKIQTPARLNFTENGVAYGLGFKLQTGKQMDIYLDYQQLPDFKPMNSVASSWKVVTLGANYYF